MAKSRLLPSAVWLLPRSARHCNDSGPASSSGTPPPLRAKVPDGSDGLPYFAETCRPSSSRLMCRATESHSGSLGGCARDGWPGTTAPRLLRAIWLSLWACRRIVGQSSPCRLSRSGDGVDGMSSEGQGGAPPSAPPPAVRRDETSNGQEQTAGGGTHSASRRRRAGPEGSVPNGDVARTLLGGRSTVWMRTQLHLGCPACPARVLVRRGRRFLEGPPFCIGEPGVIKDGTWAARQGTGSREG